jgi:uncharacterized protein YjbJ (UPF0337 family)
MKLVATEMADSLIRRKKHEQHRPQIDFVDSAQTLQPTIEEIVMAITPNRDQVKGELKDLGGKIQEEAGKLLGNRKQQAKGLKKQAQGKLQKTVGDLKKAVTDAITKA